MYLVISRLWRALTNHRALNKQTVRRPQRNRAENRRPGIIDVTRCNYRRVIVEGRRWTGEKYRPRSSPGHMCHRWPACRSPAIVRPINTRRVQSQGFCRWRNNDDDWRSHPEGAGEQPAFQAIDACRNETSDLTHAIVASRFRPIFYRQYLAGDRWHGFSHRLWGPTATAASPGTADDVSVTTTRAATNCTDLIETTKPDVGHISTRTNRPTDAWLHTASGFESGLSLDAVGKAPDGDELLFRWSLKSVWCFDSGGRGRRLAIFNVIHLLIIIPIHIESADVQGL